MFKILFYCFSLLFIFSCSKDKKNDPAPVIRIITPLDKTHFNSGDTISVEVDMTDNKNIQIAHLYINNKVTGVNLVHVQQVVNATHYVILKTLVAQAGIHYQIEAEATDYLNQTGAMEIEVVGE